MGILGRLFGKSEESPVLKSVDSGIERRRLEELAGKFRGKHYVDWVPELNRLRGLGAASEEKYLALVLECVEAAERASVYSQREPAPGYTERAAIVYRRRKDYAAEIAIIERWDAACPPERRGPGATQAKLTERLSKARELNSKV